jgi:energy-coupling factor transporter transmembrane protein EcfT
MEINLMYWACSPFQHVSPAAWVVLASLLNFRVMMVSNIFFLGSHALRFLCVKARTVLCHRTFSSVFDSSLILLFLCLLLQLSIAGRRFGQMVRR